MQLRSIDRVWGTGPWAFVATTPVESVLVRCGTQMLASFYSCALRNDPRLEVEVSPVFPPEVVRYYEGGQP